MPPPGSIAAVKRLLAGPAVALVVLASGAMASACNVIPYAAAANGATISVASLNAQLSTVQTTVAGACFLQLENPQLAGSSGQGAGGPGTYAMTLADTVLNHQVGDLLSAQYAASKGVTVAASDLATAKTDFESTLSQEVNSEVQQAAAAGTVPSCQLPDGTNITGAKLLASLPGDIQAARTRSQALDEKLLSLGADLSDQAIAAYYAANVPEFTLDCVSVIATDTQAHAAQIVAQLKGGASFATVAKANSLDSQTAANGGVLGCNYSQAGVKQALNQQAIAVGTPIAPVQDPNSGQWIIYEVTSQSVVPLSASVSVIRRDLMQATVNVVRVTKELVSFARHSDVSVNPQYGTWKMLTVVAPVAPPPQYLLASVSGSSSISPPLGVSGAGVGGASGTSGTSGTSGAASNGG